MRRIRAAGLVTLGVTTMPELGMSFSTESVKHGPTRNPWDLTRGVGGSSGGAAALVAAGAVPTRARQRRRGLDPDTGLLLRAGRPQTQPRQNPVRPGHRARRRSGWPTNSR